MNVARTVALAAIGFAAIHGVRGAAPAVPPEPAKAQELWAKSPHGSMLERILPPAVSPSQLPEPDSTGARLAVRYCVQCHHLPSPAMHTPAKWPAIVERMVWRMEGKGNMGALMKDMMADVRAPADDERVLLDAYLAKHGQREIDAKHPALATTAGRMFPIACSQCHALPDPGRHTAREWPAVVERMKGHMARANIVVGPESLRTTPVLQTGEIVRLLQRYGRPENR